MYCLLNNFSCREAVDKSHTFVEIRRQTETLLFNFDKH